MTEHPLTDEMLWEMAGTWRESSYCDGCRGAADWQLEQVLRFMEDNGFGIRKILLLKDAMRPQEDNND